MNHRSTNAARFALNGVALAAACLWGPQALALGLGRLNVTSALGETLRADIEVTSITADEAASLRLRVAPVEAYRAAGVEYNAALSSAQVQIVRLASGRQVVRVTSDRAMLEPFVDVIIEATWASGRLVREYTMLFDPPGTRTAQAPSTSTSPAITPAPSAPAAAAAAVPAPGPMAAAPTPRTPAQPRATPAEAPRPPVASAASTQPPATAGTLADGEYRVRAGDSLSRIAGRTQRPGVSLDQMLVSLFRGNPQAFVADNMNRLKSGAVLQVPAAEEAAKLPPQEARDVIVAQSNDFAAYRQRLASGTTTVADEATSRQARGQVQTQVEDRRQGAAVTPDRLQLSQGGLKASSPEARASREASSRDDRSRLAELARNVDELKRLQGATAPGTAGTAGTAAPSAPGATRGAPGTAGIPAPAPAQPTVVAIAPPPPAPVVAPPPPPAAPAPVATPAPTIATPPVALPSPAPAPVPTPAPKPAPAPAAVPPAAPAAQPGMLDSLLDNALLLPALGVLAALLAGLGLYRLRGRMRRPAGETSFLESRLQPDSFFGASGGQRIDTRDATASGSGNSSSMSYSLSQLDAIGDVDPVAEADVYLAYGRDLQAEEILKEAMRATPERMAIRSKLLEVYAKRRDTKSYELLASQMFNLTRGEGEDWVKAQALGLTIDPDNTLYQPGGAPEEVRGAGGLVVAEPLGASTLPYTVPAGAPAFKPAADATLDGDSGGLDLDLDFDMPGHKTVAMPPPASAAAASSATAPAPQAVASAPVPLSEATMPFNTGAHLAGERKDGATLDAPPSGGDAATPPMPRTPQPSAAKAVDAGFDAPTTTDDGALDFDLGDLDSHDMQRTVASKPPADPGLDFADFSIDGQPVEPLPADDDSADSAANDALARKLELAEEFRQIGDVEGARDLLEEVISKGGGTLQAKAQGMLDKL